MHKEKAIETLKEFGYFEASEKDKEIIRKEIDHSIRVAENAAMIARRVGFNPKDIDLAWLSGLLHDIGKIQILKENDQEEIENIDHGEYGARILYKIKIIRKFSLGFGLPGDWKEIVKLTVENHTKYSIRPWLKGRERKFVNMIRDADIIDKIHILKQEYEKKTVVVREDERARAEIVKCIRSNQAYRPKGDETDFENMVAICLLAYNITHQSSLILMREAQDLSTLLEMDKGWTEIEKKQLEILKGHLYRGLLSPSLLGMK